MKYRNAKELNMPLFTLGTVQLGMNYGFGEHSQKPTEEYAHGLLSAALDAGVTNLDTANNYGDSERVIGSWLRTVEAGKRPIITTKVGPFDHTSEEILRADILAQTDKCLETLGVDCIDILMVHNLEDYLDAPDVVSEVFDGLKKSGKIKYSALSVYSYHDYKVVAESGFDAVQIPINIFDWGQIENGGIAALNDAGMMVFARSVFLQGIIFCPRDEIDPRMDFILPYLDKFHAFCREFDMAPEVLAASFVLSLPGITSLVLGCQTPEQVLSNCELIDKTRTLTDEQMAKIREAFVDIDERVINPRLWYNSKPAK